MATIRENLANVEGYYQTPQGRLLRIEKSHDYSPFPISYSVHQVLIAKGQERILRTFTLNGFEDANFRKDFFNARKLTPDEVLNLRLKGLEKVASAQSLPSCTPVANSREDPVFDSHGDFDWVTGD